MKRILRAIILLSLLASCTVTGQKTYDFPTLTFKYPGDWRKISDVAPDYEQGKYFFSMHITEDLTVTSMKPAGEPVAYFSVASLEHPYEGIEAYLQWMYGMLTDYTREMVESTTTIDGFDATTFRYTRRLGPAGEAPWYQFQDIWVDTGSLIYLLSFYAMDLTGYQQEMDLIVSSFKFKYHAPGGPAEISPGISFGAAASDLGR